MNSKAIRSNKTSLPIAIYVHLADCQSQLIVNLSQLLILVRNWTKRLKGYLDPIRGCRVCLFDLFFLFDLTAFWLIGLFVLLSIHLTVLSIWPECLFNLNVCLTICLIWLYSVQCTLCPKAMVFVDTVYI